MSAVVKLVPVTACIDPNIRTEHNWTYVGFEDVYFNDKTAGNVTLKFLAGTLGRNEIIEITSIMHQGRVVVFEDEAGMCWRDCYIRRIDFDKELVYIEVPWANVFVL